MKRVVFLVVMFSLLLSLVTPAFADGDGKITTIRRTVDDGGITITITSSKYIPGNPSGDGGITPKSVYPQVGCYWVTTLSSKPLIGYFSGKSQSFTDSTKTETRPIDHILVSILMVKKVGGSTEYVASNYSSKYNTATASCGKYYTRLPLTDYVASSEHYFEADGYKSWNDYLEID